MKKETKSERITVRFTKSEKKELSYIAKETGCTSIHNGKKIPDLAKYIRGKLGL